MSRIIKMGMAAATDCLQQAATQMPDAIITGTAYGCLQDTDIFLTKMIQNNEEMLSPTAFIQSTHNTVGAQIALGLKCHNYNNTFVHRGFSFESALIDSMLFLAEHENAKVLVGGIDEITENSHEILARFGLYKQQTISNKDLIKSGTKGTLAGEGAAFFLLSNYSSPENYACINNIATMYKPENTKVIRENILSFLQAENIAIENIDIIITGRNGDCRDDKVYDEIGNSCFASQEIIPYKQLCGEYPTSAAFAVWLAASILKTGSLPSIIASKNSQQKTVKHILIYNHLYNVHHSLFLLSAC